MSLSEQLAPSIDPLVREYIDARLAEAIGRIEQRLGLEKAERDAVLASILAEQKYGGSA